MTEVLPAGKKPSPPELTSDNGRSGRFAVAAAPGTLHLAGAFGSEAPRHTLLPVHANRLVGLLQVLDVRVVQVDLHRLDG
ncbi:MAG TPA: hypothetical protein VKA37_11160, partial [Halobacteriales archaeon]|nr:hypothetical protein [Halobacteriales archaeon]